MIPKVMEENLRSVIFLLKSQCFANGVLDGVIGAFKGRASQAY